MSEEDDGDFEEEEVEEEEEEIGEEGNDDDSNEDGNILAEKSERVAKDIALLQDIFVYVDRTKLRISQFLSIQARMKDLENRASRESANAPGGDLDEDSIHWSEYEDLDDFQRAQLLEKAIKTLGKDEDRKR